MGRPLSQKLLEKMSIKVSVNGAEKTLVKQVGFNKYKTKEDGSIVTLGKDASLLIINGEKSAEVIKITKNVLYTDAGFTAAYDVKEGEIKLLDESLVFSTEVEEPEVKDDTPSEPEVEEPTVKDDTPAGEIETPTEEEGEF
jgi:hypothetical protein